VLIVVSGPIASGKSTVARALARLLEQDGLSSAVVDLDVVYDMLARDIARTNDDERWLRARRGAGALAAAFVAEGVDVVIVEGDFLTPEDRDTFLRSLPAAAEPHFVSLYGSFHSALSRVDSDPSRTASRDRAFLRRHYEAAEQAVRESAPNELVVDTDAMTADEAARAIAAWVKSE
jgi:adenylylsulfate kinase-like enzyme